MDTICKDYFFTTDMFGLHLANTDFVRLSFLCSDGRFVVNVVMPSVITFQQAMAFIVEDYTITVDGNTDFTKWKFYFFGSDEEVDMSLTPQVVARQLAQSGNYITVISNNDTENE